jgi:tetratricopeptide (TPR) repeat protein
MFKSIDHHPLIRAYRDEAGAWEKQTYDEWRLAAEDFESLLDRANSREMAAGKVFCAGQAARKMEFYEQAARYYYEAGELLPDWPLPLEGLAAAYQQLGRRVEAESCLNRALKLDGSLIQARLLFADIFCDRNNYKAAEDVLQLGLKFHPSDIGFHCFLGHIALSDRRLDIAALYYERALTLSPQCTEAYTGLSSIRIIEQKYEDALDQIKLALKYNERATGALINRGIIQYTYNQIAEAEATFDYAVSLAPRVSKNYFRLATFYWKQNNILKAERYLRLAINCESYRSHYHSALALLLLRDGKLNEAEQYYRQALLLNSEDVMALHGLSTLALISQDQQSARILITRANSLLAAGKRSLAKKLLERLHPKLQPEAQSQMKPDEPRI